MRGLRAATVIALALSLAPGASSAAAKPKPIRIGFFGPLSQRFALDGIQSRRGAALAIEEINAAGGIGGRPLELVVYDDRADKKEAAAIARRLAADGVSVVLGSAHSLSLVAAASVLSENRVPMLVTYASAFDVVNGHPYVYRWAQEADVQGYALAEFAIRQKRFSRLALLVQDDEYGRGVAHGFEAGAARWGGKLAYRRVFPVGEKEFRAQLTELAALKPDAVVGTGFSLSHVALLKQGAGLGVFPAAAYLAPCTISNIDVFRLLGPEGEGAYGIMEFMADGGGAPMEALLKRWSEAHGDVPLDHYAALNYEATLALAQVLRASGSEREAVARGLARLSAYRTVDGRLASMTAQREIMRPLLLGRYDAERRGFRLERRIEDADLLDPGRWAADYAPAP